MSGPLTEAAAEYLTMGLSVIALSGKTPNVRLHRHGLHDPLVGAPESDEDIAFIASYMEHADTTGVAIVIPYPYVVVDIDGEEGAVQWQDLNGTGHADTFLSASWVAVTGRGLHLWYSSVEPTGTIKLGSKLDLKGQGGYVAAPPSLHENGKRYEWLVAPGAQAPFEAPEPLARRIHLHNRDKERAIVGKAAHKPLRGPRYQEGDTVFYAQSGFDGLYTAVQTAIEGNRNNMLHWAAMTLAEEGAISSDFEDLQRAALEVGLDPVEVKRTIRSALRG